MARKKMPLGEWEEIEFTDYTSSHDLSDNHYNISFGICKNDGTIHISYDHHNDPLNYRVSVANLANTPEEIAWSSSSFGSNQNYLILNEPVADSDSNTGDTSDPFDGNITYPRFISKPDGNLLFECRSGWSGDGNSHLWEYNGSWSYIGEYLHGRTGSSTGYTSKCGYINGLHYTPEGTRLHVSLVWRETPTASTNHDVYYAYSDDDGRTWYNSVGDLIGKVGSNPLHYDDNGFKVYSVAQNRGLINQEAQAIDSNGKIHILQSYLLNNKADNSNWYNSRVNSYLRHIYMDESKVWHSDVIAPSIIDRSDIAVDKYDNLYVVAPGYRIYFAAASAGWQTWTEFDISQNGTTSAEGLIDREALLNQNILSCIFGTSSGDIVVPSYLLENEATGSGKGLYLAICKNDNHEIIYKQSIDSVNLTPHSYNIQASHVSISYNGILETQYAESYTLYFNVTNKTKVWINNELVVSVAELKENTEYSTTLKLQPNHTYNIRIEGSYDVNNMSIKMEWESASQTRQIVPKTALKTNFTLPISTSIKSPALTALCHPNPTKNNFKISLLGAFKYTIYNLQGIQISSGQEYNNCTIGDDLSKGVYLLKVKQETQEQLLKLIKQ